MSDSLFRDPFAEPPVVQPADPADPGAAPGSEPGPGRGAEGTLTPTVAELPLPAEQAVEAFLEYVHLWWPDALRTCGADSHLGFEDGSLLEEGLDGSRHRWAEVVGVDGASMALDWFGRREAQGAGPSLDLTVEFLPETASRTRVEGRGNGPTSLLLEWRSALEGYARFTGGTVR